MIVQEILAISTRGRGTTELTADVQRVVTGSGVRTGLCHVFVHHTA